MKWQRHFVMGATLCIKMMTNKASCTRSAILKIPRVTILS